MKNIALIFFLFTGIVAYSQNTRIQNGYYKPSSGVYVNPHMKTNQNGTNIDNFSTKNNTNPYTGVKGSRAADYSSGALEYGKGENIITGPKGGQYYNNSNGGKTYVPKRTRTW